MLRLHIDRSPANRVMAMFDASSLSFDIAPTATLEDLAGRLASLRDQRDGALIDVAVRVPSSRRKMLLY